jgi:hypothetical protein
MKTLPVDISCPCTHLFEGWDREGISNPESEDENPLEFFIHPN